MKKFVTSESVTEGHPDKLCDQIADAILDDILKLDKNARTAVEVCAYTGLVMVFGETSLSKPYDPKNTVREVISDIGYNSSDIGFDYNTCAVITSLNGQSADIAQGVVSASDQHSKDIYETMGAGDQGMMFGYATDETEDYMPLPIVLAHALTRRLAEVRKTNIIPYLRPDGKAQVTVEYKDKVPYRVDTIVLSTQHDPDIDQETLEEDIIQHVVKKAIDSKYIDDDTKIYINPTGRFVIGGPQGDSGLTGRKIIVDTYGGICPHGGGAFSGKDPTKVDRSAAYMCRYICKNLVAAGVCKRVTIQVSYAIGMAHPISIYVNTHKTGIIDDELLSEVVKKVFDLRPLAIIETLVLRNPIYRSTTNYGHFGKPGLPWEKVDKVKQIVAEVNKLKETR